MSLGTWIYIKTKNINSELFQKTINVVSDLIIGIWFFNSSLIISGRTHHDGISFWLVSTDLMSSTLFVYGVALVVLLGYVYYLLREVKNSKYINISLYIIFMMFLTTQIISKYKALQNISWAFSKESRVALYKAEKMLLFYNNRNEVPLLASIGWLGLHSTVGGTYVYPCTHFLAYMDKLYRPLEVYKNNTTNLEFYKTGYNTTNADIAYKIYLDNGGEFTDKELDELNFTYLYKLYKIEK